MNLHLQRFSILFFLLGILSNFWHQSQVQAAWQQPPHEFPVIGSSNALAVASDANGHAFAIPNDITLAEDYASYYSSGIWQDPPELIGTGSPSESDLAMDNTGTALAIWYAIFDGDIRTANFDGSSWITPTPDPLDTVGTFNAVSLAIAMNGPNSGVAVWTDNNATTVRSSFFFGGAWSAVTPIGTGNFNASVGYSTNGNAVAGWFDLSAGTTVNNFIGGWQGPIVLDPSGSEANVGISSNGKALAVWANGSGRIVYSVFNGITWTVPQLITAITGNFDVSLEMTPGGTAVATWQDSTNAGFSSSYNGSTWSAPILITPGPIASPFGHLALSVSDNGNAIAAWPTATQIRSSRLPLGGVWTPEDFVTDFTGDTVSLIDVSLSEDGTGFAAWILGSEGSRQFASATVPPTSPSNLRGFCCKNKFAMQSECVNNITWNPSTDPTVISYNVRRNDVLVASISTQGPFTLEEHVPCRGENTYTITAVDISGVESQPISITLSCR